MTTTNDKIRGLFLSALMVMSVVAGTAAFAGTAVANHTNNDLSHDVNLDDVSVVYAGQVVLSENADWDDDDTVELRSGNPGADNDNQFEDTLETYGEHVIINTAGLETGDYYLVNDDNGDVQFEVVEQDFSVSPDEADLTTASENLLIDIGDGNRAGGFDINVSTRDDDAGLIDGDDGNHDYGYVTGVNEGDEDVAIPLQVDDIPTGNFTVYANVTDADVTETIAVNVTEAADDTASFATDFVSEERGDVGLITVNLTGTQSAYVNVGSAESNYAASAELTDSDGDGQVSVLFNTFETTGDPFTQVEDTDLGATEEIYGVGSPAAAGQYNMNVTFGAPYDGGGDGIADDFTEESIGTFTIEQRSTDTASSWAAPANSLDGADEVSDVLSAVDDDDSTAVGDYVVVEIGASGLYGYIADSQMAGGPDDHGLSLTFVETNTEPNTDRTTFNAEESDAVSIIPDGTNNTFYAVVDTSADFADHEGDDPPEAGDNYRATFTIANDDDLPGAPDNVLLADGTSESVNTTFTLQDKEAGFAEDPYHVPQSEVNVTGTTTLADGTSITVRARSPENNLLRTKQVTVENGDWSAPFDFSGVDNGTEFTFSVVQTETTVNAMVNDQLNQPDTTTTTETTETTTTETTTTTTTTTTMTTTETTTTEAPDTDTTTEEPETEETTTTDDDGGGAGIPGFGMAVSLVALVAAALLALRRSN